MKKLLTLAAFLLLTAMTFQLHAQSLRNADWKTYIGGEINDTITLHIHSDSSLVTNSAGAVFVRSLCKISGDTLTLNDYDGPYACPNMEGKYRIHLEDSHLTLSLISDPCDGRLHAIDGIKWVKWSK